LSDTKEWIASMQQTMLNATAFRRLRGILAERRITHKQFARVCGLNRAYLGRVLCGTTPAGELAQLKIAQGIAALGLDKEADTYAAAS
jgi:hypothetical protein